ncbi:DUF3987 domain-containing protein [Streptomyces sp. NPDC057555]|uniref:DUF3987 domain-containing protein n=1 Tax=Streptomyces sp. NPDC057555 TaxID=3346166 RepID=UPI0036C2DA14
MTPVLYGPIGRAVEEVGPHAETDPIGIYAACLSMWSAAIGGTVRVNRRTPLVWTALVGRTGLGKGVAYGAAEHIMRPAIGRFLDTHTVSGLTSGASLVNHLWQQQQATEETESGRDVRVLVAEEEWSESLRRARRDHSFTPNLRIAWDGKTLRNTTKEEHQEVTGPALVMHGHITPSDWNEYVSVKEAAGGTFNRFLPITLSAVPMLDDDAFSLPALDVDDLAEAYAWATARPRTIVLGTDAKPLWRLVRRYGRILNATLPEHQAVFIQRTEEQTLRVAACLAAAECSTTITHAMLSAALSFVRHSIRSVTALVAAADEGKRHGPVTAADKVRAVIQREGTIKKGDLMRAAKIPAAQLDAVLSDMGDVATQRHKTGGRPATVLSLTEPEHQEHRPNVVNLAEKRRTRPHSPHAPQPPAQTQREQNASADPFATLRANLH